MIQRKVTYPFDSTFLDYPDNESISALIRLIGCDHNCNKCQNPQLRDYNYQDGKEFSPEEIIPEFHSLCDRLETNKIVLSGGDPLSKHNIEWTKTLLDLSSKNFDYCIYTGYDIDWIVEHDIKGFKFIKTGIYVSSLSKVPVKTNDFMRLASMNQCLYNSDLELLTIDGILRFKNKQG